MLGVGNGEDYRLLIDHDAGCRIGRSKQQIATLVDVLTMLDAAAYTTNEDVIANQDWQSGIAPELVTQRQRSDLSPLERCAVSHIGGRVRIVLG